MTEERDTLRRGVAWVRGMADAVRRALGLCDQNLEIHLGPDFQVGAFGKPLECGPNQTGRSCWPGGAEGPGDAVRIREIVAALARLDELAELVQQALGPSPIDPEVLARIRSRVPAP